MNTQTQNQHSDSSIWPLKRRSFIVCIIKNILDDSNTPNHMNDDVKLVLERLCAHSALHKLWRIRNGEKSNKNSDKENSRQRSTLSLNEIGSLLIIPRIYYWVASAFFFYFSVFVVHICVCVCSTLSRLSEMLKLYFVIIFIIFIHQICSLLFIYFVVSSKKNSFAICHFTFIIMHLWIIIIIVIVPLSPPSTCVKVCLVIITCYSLSNRIEADFIYSIIIISFMAPLLNV